MQWRPRVELISVLLIIWLAAAKSRVRNAPFAYKKGAHRPGSGRLVEEVGIIGLGGMRKKHET